MSIPTENWWDMLCYNGEKLLTLSVSLLSSLPCDSKLFRENFRVISSVSTSFAFHLFRLFLKRRYYLQSSYWDAEPEAKKCGFSGFCRRETGYLFSWRFPLGACSPVLRGGPIMLIPLNPTLKPWADITSQGVFNGLINGVGAYIRGGYKRNAQNVWERRDISEKRIKANKITIVALLPY